MLLIGRVGVSLGARAELVVACFPALVLHSWVGDRIWDGHQGQRVGKDAEVRVAIVVDNKALAGSKVTWTMSMIHTFLRCLRDRTVEHNRLRRYFGVTLDYLAPIT